VGTGRHIGVEVGSCEYQLEYKVCFGFYGVGRGGQGHQIGVKAELERLTGPSVPGKKHVWAGWARDCTGSRDSRKAVRGSPHTLRETANTIPFQPCGIIWSVIASPSTREMSCLVSSTCSGFPGRQAVLAERASPASRAAGPGKRLSLAFRLANRRADASSYWRTQTQ